MDSLVQVVVQGPGYFAELRSFRRGCKALRSPEYNGGERNSAWRIVFPSVGQGVLSAALLAVQPLCPKIAFVMVVVKSTLRLQQPLSDTSVAQRNK